MAILYSIEQIFKATIWNNQQSKREGKFQFFSKGLNFLGKGLDKEILSLNINIPTPVEIQSLSQHRDIGLDIETKQTKVF